jgi:hypothetical protein
MSGCCDDYFCKRRKPILIRKGGLSDRWFAVTAYTVMPDHPGTVRSANGGKHDITDDIEQIRAEARQEGYEAGLADQAGFLQPERR